MKGIRRESRRASLGLGAHSRNRRESVHESSPHRQAKMIKRNFYGLEEADSMLQLFWKTYSAGVTSLLIVCLYYLFGYLYYSSTEGWDGLTCIYFQTVTLTTVGYGDFSPTTVNGKVFTMFYIFAGIAIVGRIINEFAQSILDFAEKKAHERRGKKFDQLTDDEKGSEQISAHLNKIFTSVGAIFLCLLMGALFYHKNEEWDFVTALYFCVVTTTTVGYGDTTLTKESSRLFAVFYILSSCIIVALAIGNLASVRLEIINEKKRISLLSRKLDFNFIRELDSGGKGINKTTFLVAMLVNLELVDKTKDVEPWLQKFDELDTKNTGIIDFDETIEDLEREEKERIRKLEEELESHHHHNGALDLFGNASALFHFSGSETQNDEESTFNEIERSSYVDNPMRAAEGTEMENLEQG